MFKKINLNDATAWSQMDWDEPEIHPLLKRTDATVNRSRTALTKRDNPAFSATMSEAAHKRNQQTVYQANYQAGIAARDNTYQARDNARPEKRAQISASMTGRTKSAEHQAKIAARNQERSKPIQTPHGEFPSRKAAVEHMLEIGIVNAGRKLDKWLKTRPTEYYYIDK
jgi:hypothetical protein